MASPLGEITLSLLLVVLTASGCAGREFIVASGPNGWTVPDQPLEDFQINDTLVFKYDKDVDAVLLVSQGHYDACDTTEPLTRFDGGECIFGLNSVGNYYFISADATRCQAGERLRVVVHDIAPSAHPPPPPKSASSSSTPPPPPPDSASSPPPVPSSPAQSVLPPSSPPHPSSAGNNASSPSPAPMTAPVPWTKNATGPQSTSSPAIALRAGVLACLTIGASAAIL